MRSVCSFEEVSGSVDRMEKEGHMKEGISISFFQTD